MNKYVIRAISRDGNHEVVIDITATCEEEALSWARLKNQSLSNWTWRVTTWDTYIRNYHTYKLRKYTDIRGEEY